MMLTNGIVKGILQGEFVWAKVGSEMKLVRIGSVLHSSLIEATKDSKMKKIGQRDLQVGHIYSGKDGRQWIFLGYIDIATRAV